MQIDHSNTRATEEEGSETGRWNAELISVLFAFGILLLCGCGSIGTGRCGMAISAPWITSPLPPTAGSSMVVDVKDFGAIGDGARDDSIPFRNALAKLDASGGGTLLIPPGNYLVGDLKIGSGVFIVGTGTPQPVLAKAPSATSILQLVSNSAATRLHDIDIEKITLRGRSVQDGFSEHVHNLLVAGVVRLTIRDVAFEAFQGDGTYLGTRFLTTNPIHNSDVEIVDSSFDGVNSENRNGVSVIDCSRCAIERNTFSRVTSPQMPGAIDIEPNLRDEVIYDIAVVNNTIASDEGVVGGISVLLGYKNFARNPGHILIQGNKIQNSRTGIIVNWIGTATNATPSLDSLVWGNIVKVRDHPIVLNGLSGVTVMHNEFAGSALDVEIGCDFGAFDVHFRDNDFVGVGATLGHGFTLCGPLHTVDFEGNAFVDVGSTANGASAMHFATGSVADFVYSKNIFSSPNHITRLATTAGSSVVFLSPTNIWEENVLNDGIQAGDFPHIVGLLPHCQ